MQFTITEGDNRDTLKNYPDNYFDSIITDPPYGIDFLGKSWDANTGALETYTECLRVLKPGGHILAFSAARTYHHLAITLEQAGFEIRDQIMWIYGSGFPKAQDIGKAIDKRNGKGKDQTVKAEYNGGMHGPKNVPIMGTVMCSVCKKDGNARYTCDKGQECGMVYKAQTAEAQQWSGWKTALKPAHEPICMARKPFKGSAIDNVLAHGVGALNIDATRIGDDEMPIGAHDQTGCLFNPNKKSQFAEETVQGRFPSNVLGEVEDYQKYFYCPKVSRRERHTGFDTTYIPTDPSGMNDKIPGGNPGDNYQSRKSNVGNNTRDPQIKTEDKKGNGIDRVCETCGVSILRPQECKCPTKSWVRPIKTGNNHPTVKPVALMRYLIKLVTPPNGKVLDPFSGSGSTGMAAVELGHEFTGCELDPAYVKIAETRIRAWNTEESSGTTYEDLFQEPK